MPAAPPDLPPLPPVSSRRYWYGLLGWFSLTTTCLILMGLYVNRSLENSIEDSIWVSHTHEVIETLEETLSALKDAETAERGYVITGNESYLQPYYSARNSASNALGRLDELTRGNALQQQNLARLRQAVGKKLDRVDAIIDTRRNRGGDAATDAVNTGLGKRLMDEAREIDTVMINEERRLLDIRRQAERDSATTTQFAVKAGTLASLAILFLIFYLVVRESRRRNRVERAAREANRQLEASVATLTALRNELTGLATLGDMLQSSHSFDEAYAMISRSLPRLFPDSSGAVGMMKASHNLIETVLSWGDTAVTHEMFSPDECWSLRRGRMHLVSDADHELACAHTAHQAGRHYLCQPMAAHGRTTGVLVLSRPAETGFDDSARELARRVAELVSLSLANLSLQESLRLQSISDPLTGLYNRRYMESALERELARESRRDQSICLLMCDIDHFKRFNDTHGHEAGDLVLVEFARLLKSMLRKEDILCRYGGEEFLVILADTPRVAGLQRADAIRLAVSQLQLHYRNQSLGSITLSLGMSVFPRHGSDPVRLIHTADQALYAAKQAGRDRVIEAPAPEIGAAAPATPLST